MTWVYHNCSNPRSILCKLHQLKNITKKTTNSQWIWIGIKQYINLRWTNWKKEVLPPNPLDVVVSTLYQSGLIIGALDNGVRDLWDLPAHKEDREKSWGYREIFFVVEGARQFVSWIGWWWRFHQRFRLKRVWRIQEEFVTKACCFEGGVVVVVVINGANRDGGRLGSLRSSAERSGEERWRVEFVRWLRGFSGGSEEGGCGWLSFPAVDEFVMWFLFRGWRR